MSEHADFLHGRARYADEHEFPRVAAKFRAAAVKIERLECEVKLLVTSFLTALGIEPVPWDETISEQVERGLEQARKLRASVERLPKTADGASVVPGMQLYLMDVTNAVVAVEVFDYEKRYATSVPSTCHCATHHCYSTREAAMKGGTTDADGQHENH